MHEFLNHIFILRSRICHFHQHPARRLNTRLYLWEDTRIEFQQAALLPLLRFRAL